MIAFDEGSGVYNAKHFPVMHHKVLYKSFPQIRHGHPDVSYFAMLMSTVAPSDLAGDKESLGVARRELQNE